MADNQTTPSDPSTWQPYSSELATSIYGDGEYMRTTSWVDPSTGSIYQGQNTDSLILDGKAKDNPYINTLLSGYYNPISNTQAQKLYEESVNNPHQFYTDAAGLLSDNFLKGATYNDYDSSLYDTLQKIKSVDPAAYYPAEIKYWGSQLGWASGQGRSDYAAQYQDKLKSLYAGAQQAGMTPESINPLVQSSYQSGATNGAQYLQNIASTGGSGFNFSTDVLPGLEFVGAAALAATGVGAGLENGALAGETAAGGAAGTAPIDVATGVTVPLSELGTSTGTGLDAASTLGMGGTGGAGSASGIAATQSAAGLGGSGTGIIEGLAPTSVGMGGTAGAGSLAGIAGSEAIAGLGGANLGYGLTAEQLAQYEAANPSVSASNVSKLSNLLKQGAGAGLTNSLGQLAQGSNPQGMALPNLVRGNQNPFAQSQNFAVSNPKPDLSALANLLKQG